jgi:polyisoprenoid-binding protein YceI
MNKFKAAMGTVAAVFILGAASLAQAAPMAFKVDPVHSTILFRVQHMSAGQFWGRFNDPSGTVVWDAEDPTKSSIEVSVQSKNLDTHNAKRDQDLAGPDFFNSKQYPELKFKTTAVKKTGDNTYEVAGDLTIKDVTKSITAAVEMTGLGKDPRRGTAKAGWEATFTINRSDYGVTAMPGGVGESVKLIVSIEANEQQ